MSMVKINKVLALVILALAMGACSKRAGIVESRYGVLSSGEPVKKFLLTNDKGCSMMLTDYGARIISIMMPDRKGVIDDVIVGPGCLDSLERGRQCRFFGCVLGRYANRINNSSFTLEDGICNVDANESIKGVPVHCHGGVRGFDRFVWESESIYEEGRLGVRFHRMSPDLESGFPGNCDCYVTYWLDNDNRIKVEYEATTDKTTIINLSNHSYFNLKGHAGGYVMDHRLVVEADSCIQNNLQKCPDLVLPVEGTPFDFRMPNRVDYRIDKPNRQLEIMHGMSACWCIRGWDGTLRKAADLYDPLSGRGVETWTTEPALLTYTGRNFDGKVIGKYGPIEKFSAMLLETMHFADSPNQSRFPSTVLHPGEKYYNSTEWHFYAK